MFGKLGFLRWTGINLVIMKRWLSLGQTVLRWCLLGWFHRCPQKKESEYCELSREHMAKEMGRLGKGPAGMKT